MAATADPVTRYTSSAPAPVEFTTWPVRDEGLRAVPMLSVMLVVLVAVVIVAGWLAACVAALVLFLAAWRFFLPVRVEIKETGVFQTVLGHRRRIAWETVGHCDVCRHGILLTPDRRHTGPLEALRGIYIDWGSRQEEVLPAVLFHLERTRRRSERPRT